MQIRIVLLTIIALMATLFGCDPSRQGKSDEEIEQQRLESVKFDEEMALCLMVPSKPTELPIESKLKAEGLFAAWRHALRQAQDRCNHLVYAFVKDPDRAKDFPISSKVKVDLEVLRNQMNAVELIYVRSLADIVFFEGEYPSLKYFCAADTVCNFADRATMTKSLTSLIRDWNFELSSIRTGLTLESLKVQRQKGIAEALNVWKGMSHQGYDDTKSFTKYDLMVHLCERFGPDINAHHSDSLRCP